MKSIFKYYLLIIVGFVTANELNYEYSQIDEAQKKTAFIGGDLMIGALFPIHEAPAFSGQKNPLKCGAVREQYGIQRIEVALRTVDLINKSPSILPNITLGIEIRDTCWSPLIALHQSLQFVQKLFVTKDWYSCRRNSPKNICESNPPPILGVIGPASSEEAIQVQNLLQLFHIPQVGYSTTSSSLSDKEKFEYFIRLVPSDQYQAQVMIDVLQKFDWNFVFAIHSEGEYGRSGMNEFHSLAKTNNICIAGEFAINDYSKNEELERIIRTIDQNSKAKVIICFCEGDAVRKLFEATKKMNKSRSFVFIGSDGWGGRNDVVRDLEETAQGNIIISIHSTHVSDFDSFYFDLIKNISNERNPWFEEYRNSRFNCSSENDKSGYRACGGNEFLKESYSQDPKLSFIVKSIYTLAHALHKYRNDVCGQNAPVCTELYPINGTMFMSYLRKISFKYRDEEVKFDENGDPEAKYDILNYQKFQNGTYGYRKVGSWKNYNLNLNPTAVQLPDNAGIIRSVCSEPCPPGYIKSISQNGGENRTCCWSCIKCKSREVSDGESCKQCEKGYKPDVEKKKCVEMVHEYTQYTDLIGIICSTFALIGILLTLATVSVFYKFGNTPVVKSSTKELCYMMLGGMILTHLCTFIIIGKPNKLRCSLLRIIPGFGISIIFSALLVKTNRISRILSISKKRFPTLKPKFMSTSSQVYICCMFVCTEFLICIVSLFMDPANVNISIVQSHGNGGTFDKAVLECYCTDQNKRHDLIIQFSFNILLLLFCTLYAVKTRKLPNNFNEAKYIGFACYATLITWLAFLSIYLGSSFQLLSQCISLSTVALINLVFLFFPKLYIILWRPEKNTRANFTTTKNLRCHFGSTYLIHTCEQLLNGMIKNGFAPNISTVIGTDQIKQTDLGQQITKKRLNSEIETKSCQTSFTELYRKISDPSLYNEEVISDPEITL